MVADTHYIFGLVLEEQKVSERPSFLSDVAYAVCCLCDPCSGLARVLQEHGAGRCGMLGGRSLL